MKTSLRGVAFQELSACVEALKPELSAFIQAFVRMPSLPGEEHAVQALVASKLRELSLQEVAVATKVIALMLARWCGSGGHGQ